MQTNSKKINAEMKRLDKREAKNDRRAKKLTPIDALLTEPSEPSFLEKLAIADQVEASLRQLKPQDQLIVIMRHLERHTRTEIATSLNLTEDAVDQRLVRALEAMRAYL